MAAGAAAVGYQQQQYQQQQPAAGALGFDDAAFGPVDDWRVLGDVQQWHRALLTKEKVTSAQHTNTQRACALLIAITVLASYRLARY